MTTSPEDIDVHLLLQFGSWGVSEAGLAKKSKYWKQRVIFWALSLSLLVSCPPGWRFCSSMLTYHTVLLCPRPKTQRSMNHQNSEPKETFSLSNELCYTVCHTDGTAINRSITVTSARRWLCWPVCFPAAGWAIGSQSHETPGRHPLMPRSWGL